MLKPKAGIALPALIGGILFWLPAWIVNHEAGPEASPALWITALMPAWSLMLWWSFVSKCALQSQRVGVPLASLVVAWLAGPLVLGESASLMLSPLMTFMLASYAGALFGLIAASAVIIVLAALGFRKPPQESESNAHEQVAGA